LLKINERVIARSEFDAAFARSAKPEAALAASERQALERSFLNQLIDHELTLAEIQRRGIAVTPAELGAALAEHRSDYPPGGFEAMLVERGLTLDEWQNELRQSLLLGKLADQVLGERHRVGAQAIDDYYHAHRADFERPAQVRARQIVVAERSEGEQLLARLRKGEVFSELARRHSLSPEAAQGGDLGFFARDEMPPEFEAVFTLPIGVVSPLIKSDYGYHLFLVEEKRQATRLNRQEAEKDIRVLLEAERRDALFQEWLQELRGKATIEIDWRQLDSQP
jgi:peptidyl-prolyl cis-trans isomerase C